MFLDSESRDSDKLTHTFFKNQTNYSAHIDYNTRIGDWTFLHAGHSNYWCHSTCPSLDLLTMKQNVSQGYLRFRATLCSTYCLASVSQTHGRATNISGRELLCKFCTMHGHLQLLAQFAALIPSSGHFSSTSIDDGSKTYLIFSIRIIAGCSHT